MPKCDCNKATPFPKNTSEWLLLKDEKPRQNNCQAIQMGALKNEIRKFTIQFSPFTPL